MSEKAEADFTIVRLLYERRMSDLLVALADLIEHEGHRIADESLLRLDLAVRSAKTLGSMPVKGRC